MARAHIFEKLFDNNSDFNKKFAKVMPYLLIGAGIFTAGMMRSSYESGKLTRAVNAVFADEVKQNPDLSRVTITKDGVTMEGDVQRGFFFDGANLRQDVPCHTALLEVTKGMGNLPFSDTFFDVTDRRVKAFSDGKNANPEFRICVPMKAGK